MQCCSNKIIPFPIIFKLIIRIWVQCLHIPSNLNSLFKSIWMQISSYSPNLTMHSIHKCWHLFQFPWYTCKFYGWDSGASCWKFSCNSKRSDCTHPQCMPLKLHLMETIKTVYSCKTGGTPANIDGMKVEASIEHLVQEVFLIIHLLEEKQC